jgi:hypothetical protein
VDITFGDYLRALITADYDLVPNDVRRYRVAFIEAFRRHGIYPEDVRSLSEESLIWESPEKWGKIGGYFSFINNIQEKIVKWDTQTDREEMFIKCNDFIVKTKEIFAKTSYYKQKFLRGIFLDENNIEFEVHSIRPVRRISPDGDLLTDVLVEITQRIPGYHDRKIGDRINHEDLNKNEDTDCDFWFRGGVTILIDMRSQKVRYCIYKNIESIKRYEKQREYSLNKSTVSSSRSMYFKDVSKNNWDKTFAMLHR